MKESTPTTNITEYFHKLTKELKIPLESATRGVNFFLFRNP